MISIVKILKSIGLLKTGSGDYSTGEFQANAKKDDSGNQSDSEKKPELKKSGPNKKFPLLIFSLFAFIFLFMSIGLNLLGFIIMLFVWTAVFYIVIKFSFSLLLNFVVLFFTIIISLSVIVATAPSQGIIEQDSDSLVTEVPVVDEIGTETISETVATEEVIDTVEKTKSIYIEAESGELLKGGEYSRLGESSRGGEAYLGDGGATVQYFVDSKTSGLFSLSIRLSDDNLHASGYRSATIKINDKTLTYSHISEDTKGWKWFEIGDVNLQEGNNEIKFIKAMTTPAAFIMDAFKLERKE